MLSQYTKYLYKIKFLLFSLLEEKCNFYLNFEKKLEMGVIEIKGMEFHSFIGHYDEEKQIGNNFRVDINLWYDSTKAEKSDRLRDALDYQAVYNIVKQQMNIKCNLIENAAYRILEALWDGFPQLERIEVRLSKLFPKLGGIVNEVAIKLEREKK